MPFTSTGEVRRSDDHKPSLHTCNVLPHLVVGEDVLRDFIGGLAGAKGFRVSLGHEGFTDCHPRQGNAPSTRNEEVKFDRGC